MIAIEDIVRPYLSSYPTIRLSQEDIDLLDGKSRVISNKKKSESTYLKDNRNINKRWGTGIRGEMAVQRFIERQYIDLTVGYSKEYDKPDLHLLGLNIGVKTSDYKHGKGSNSALVSRDSLFSEPQVIVLILEHDLFAVCGYADERVINMYRSDYYVVDKNALKRKTGFYGYDQLVQFNSWNELATLAEDYLIRR
jgi:hypothetical protein